MKRCIKCEKTKTNHDFTHAKRNTDQLHGTCKECRKEERLFNKTKIGFIAQRKYTSMKKRNRDRGHGEMPFTIDEFREWFYAWPNLKQMHEKYMKSGYSKWWSITIDRINDNLGYSFDNMQVVYWRYNSEKRQKQIPIAMEFYFKMGIHLKPNMGADYVKQL